MHESSNTRMTITVDGKTLDVVCSGFNPPRLEAINEKVKQAGGRIDNVSEYELTGGTDMSKNLKMGIALALMTAIPSPVKYSDSNYDPYQRKEQWQGNGKRKRPKAR